MSGRAGIVAAIVGKDFREFSRDRFYVFMTILGLVFYVVIYWFLPNSVDETLEIGLHHEGLGGLVDQLTEIEGQGVSFTNFDSAESLRAAVEGEGDTSVVVGLDFPADFSSAVAAGAPTTVSVLLTADVPDEYRTAMTSFVREMAFLAAGAVPPITQPVAEELILGEDRAGDQVALREKMGPMIVFFALLVETFALATLVATEVQAKTVTAVLSTPARVSDFLVAKSLFGTILAFGQALLIVVLIGVFGINPPVILVTLLLGSILVTGFGLMAGSTGGDFVSIIFWSMLFMVPLAIPSFAVLFPGTAAGWVRMLPSYGLVDAMIRSTAYREAFADVVPSLLTLAAWCVVVFGAGWLVLRRKVATL